MKLNKRKMSPSSRYYHRNKDNPEFKEKIRLRNKTRYARYRNDPEMMRRILDSNKRSAQKVSIRLARLLRDRIKKAIKNNYKSGSAVRDLGCTISDFKLYLESKFQVGMTWDNHGEWHLDHIKPLKLFDLTNREQFLQACHYTNIQPLWAQDNLEKSGKYAD